MEKLKGILNTLKNNKVLVVIVVAVLGYFGYDSISEALGLTEVIASDSTAVVVDTLGVTIDTSAVAIDTTIVE